MKPMQQPSFITFDYVKNVKKVYEILIGHYISLYELNTRLYGLLFIESIYLFKLNNRNTRKRYEACAKLTIKSPERRQSITFDVCIFNFEHISHFSSVSVVDYQKVNIYSADMQFINPAGIRFFKSIHGSSKTMFEICSKLTIKTPE